MQLTDLKEGDRVKCEKYWPDEIDLPEYYGGACSMYACSIYSLAREYGAS